MLRIRRDEAHAITDAGAGGGGSRPGDPGCVDVHSDDGACAPLEPEHGLAAITTAELHNVAAPEVGLARKQREQVAAALVVTVDPVVGLPKAAVPLVHQVRIRDSPRKAPQGPSR